MLGLEEVGLGLSWGHDGLGVLAKEAIGVEVRQGKWLAAVVSEPAQEGKSTTVGLPMPAQG